VRFRTPDQLLPQRERLWQIMAGIATVSRAEWEEDFLSTRLYAVFLSRGRIVGYTRVLEETFELEGRKILTIGLGQAVVETDFRNQFLVQRALIFRWLRAFVHRPLRPIYIWGACISYKSYLSFTRVLHLVYPRVGVATPPSAQQVIHLLGERWHGARYLRSHGAIAATDVHLHDPAVQPTEQDLLQPDIRFFVESLPKLPGTTVGLLTVSPCVRENFLPMVRGWVRNLWRKKRRKPGPRPANG
jgi:hypothetical protein